MKLIIAEKPSVARAIAAIVGATEVHPGHLEGKDYLVSWCYGHLIEFAAAEAYDKKYEKWRYEDLPILPSPWQFNVSKDSEVQFAFLKTLINDPRVTSLVCATDAGREGELIFRLVYHVSGCNKPFERMWINSMEDSAIRNGLEQMKDGSAYDRLYQSALCRAQADWIVGINASRLFSVLSKEPLNIGRVMTPTLAMIIEREAAITAFKSEPFYTATLNCDGFQATSDRLPSKATAEALRSACTGKPATVKDVTATNKTEHPPHLYDLTALQRDANRILGYTAQQTLDYAQSLYERKLLTYPRTDSRFIPSGMDERVNQTILAAAKMLPFTQQLNTPKHLEQITNDAKVSDHHAILPTSQIESLNLTTLPLGEQELMKLVSTRLLCAVGDAHLYTETVADIQCDTHLFTAKGKTIQQTGWKDIETAYLQSLNLQREANDAPTLPDLTCSQVLQVTSVEIKEGKTTPPKHFTEDTLLSAMEAAGKDEMPDDAECKGLGTPATRAGTLEKLIRTQLIQRKGNGKVKHLVPTEKGIALVGIVPETIKSSLLTAEWEYRLKEIEHGASSADSFMGDIASYTAELVLTHTPETVKPIPKNRHQESIGLCPRCQSPVVEHGKSFSCTNDDCQFVLWKDNLFFADKHKKIDRKIAATLLKDGRVKVEGLHSKKTGRTYDALVVLHDTGGKYVNFKLEFVQEKSGATRKAVR